jgi:hypothetical protein
VGSDLKLDCAFIDTAASQAICCWDAPDRQSVEALFQRAGVKPEAVRQVEVCTG